MTKKQQNEPDYGLSVRFRPERTLGRDFIRLKILLGDKLIQEVKSKTQIRGNTPLQLYEALDCILANFLEAHRRSTKCFVAIPLSTRLYTKSRYFCRNFGHMNFIRALEFLKSHQPALVEFKNGFIDYETKNGRVSRFIPSKNLLNIFNGYARLWIEAKSKKRNKRQAPISIEEVLTYSRSRPSTRIPIALTASRYRQASDCIRLKDNEKQLKPYTDTEPTRQMRIDLEKWNDFLEKDHHIDLLLSDHRIEHLYEKEDGEQELEAFYNDERDQARYVEFERVRLYRVFNNGSFDEGGRFYGGWWQQIPSKSRKFITINGRSTWEYDYSSLHPAMLYAELGLPLADDAYGIDGIEPTEYNRKLIKRTFLSLINARKGQRIDRPRVAALPEGWTWEDLQKSIMEKHAPLKDHFHTGIGLKLQRRDAEIAVTVMKRMMAKGILVLPIHDSFITYHEIWNVLESEMRRAYKEHVGNDIAIKADVSLLDVVASEPVSLKLDSLELVANLKDQHGHDGYRTRYETFLKTRSPQWFKRFEVL